jgi:hypothetical protein
MTWFLSNFPAECAVIKQAPLAFITALIFMAVLIYYFIKAQFSTSITSLNAIISLKDEIIADFKRKLDVNTPDEAKARVDALESQVVALARQVAAISPIKITKEQREIMTPILDKFAGCAVQISADAVSDEAAEVSKGLAAAFSEARWTVSTPAIMGPQNLPPTGIALRVADPASLRDQDRAIADAFNAAGIKFDLQLNGRRFPSNFIRESDGLSIILLSTRLHE